MITETKNCLAGGELKHLFFSFVAFFFFSFRLPRWLVFHLTLTKVLQTL
jgi:hypothetical protein